MAPQRPPQPLPWQHEPVATLTQALRDGKSALDASDTGTGKTWVALFAAKAAVRQVGIICPKSVIPSWQSACAALDMVPLFVCNVERLKQGGNPCLKKLGKKSWKWELPANVTIIFDEVHRFGASDSENATLLASAPAPVLMLSATAASDPTKMRAIGHQLRLTTWMDWWRWCGKNGCKKGYFGGIEFKGTKTHLDNLHRQIFATGRGVRVRVSDLGDQFPHTQHILHSVPVENQVAINEAYAKELEDLKNGILIVDLLRSRQISEHQKLGAVSEMIEDDLDTGHSVAVFVNFRESLEYFQKEHDAAVIHGSQTDDARQENIALFRNDDAEVICCMIQAGGCGLNGLQDFTGNKPRIGYIFPGYSAVDIRQALGRLPRADSKSHVIYRWIFAAETVEDRIKAKVETKLARIDLLNDGDLTATQTTTTQMKNGKTESPSLLPEVSVPPAGGNNAVPKLHSTREHSKVGPSRLKSLEICPSQEDDPNAEIHPITAEGTLGHEALDSGDDSHLTTDDQRRWVKMCRDFTGQFMPAKEYRELRLDILDGVWGFADLVLLDEKETHATLIDYKFGMSSQEDVATNPAAQAYVLGIFQRWNTVEQVAVYYLYPRREEISQHAFDRADIPRLKLRIQTIVARVQTDEPGMNPSPDVCQWCRKKATCPALHKAVLPIATRYAERKEMVFPEIGDFSLVKDPATWSKLMAAAPVLEAMADSIKRHALEFRQESGKEIPGYEMRQRQGRKSVSNAILAWEVAKQFGLSQQQFLSAVDVSAKRLADAAGENAPRGAKQKQAAELEGKLRDAGVLEIGAEVFYLARSKN